MTRVRYRPSGIPDLEWLARNSHPEPGPLPTPCLIWEGATIKGYGHTTSSTGQECYTHRLAWLARYGQIPAETPLVLHRCDNPPCFAEDHLWLGTHADNQRDKIAKGRATHPDWGKSECIYGHPFTPENTRINRDGDRACRACHRRRQAAYLAKRHPVS